MKLGDKVTWNEGTVQWTGHIIAVEEDCCDPECLGRMTKIVVTEISHCGMDQLLRGTYRERCISGLLPALDE